MTYESYELQIVMFDEREAFVAVASDDLEIDTSSYDNKYAS